MKLKDKFIISASFTILFLVVTSWAFAVEFAIVGTLKADETVKHPGDVVTVVFTVENGTKYLWIPEIYPDYYYEIFEIGGTQGGGSGQVNSGYLEDTLEPYVAANSSGAFAIGSFPLVNYAGQPLHPALYRILLYAEEFHNPNTGDIITIHASTAIRIEFPGQYETQPGLEKAVE